MTCKDLTNDLLLDYSDWQLAPHERNRVARHLEVCEPCRLRRDELEGMSTALHRSVEAPPAALMTQLDKAVLETWTRSATAPLAPLPRPRRLWPLAAAGLAAVLLVGIVASFVGRSVDRSPAARPVVRDNRPAPAVDPAPEPPAEPVLAQPPRPRPERPIVPPPPPPPAPAPVVAQEPVKGPAPTVPAPVVAKRGDLNADGLVDIADARILQQLITQGLPLPAHADVNGDGTVDIADVREILRVELAAR